MVRLRDVRQSCATNDARLQKPKHMRKVTRRRSNEIFSANSKTDVDVHRQSPKRARHEQTITKACQPSIENITGRRTSSAFSSHSRGDARSVSPPGETLWQRQLRKPAPPLQGHGSLRPKPKKHQGRHRPAPGNYVTCDYRTPRSRSTFTRSPVLSMNIRTWAEILGPVRCHRTGVHPEEGTQQDRKLTQIANTLTIRRRLKTVLITYHTARRQ